MDITKGTVIFRGHNNGNLLRFESAIPIAHTSPFSPSAHFAAIVLTSFAPLVITSLSSSPPLFPLCERVFTLLSSLFPLCCPHRPLLQNSLLYHRLPFSGHLFTTTQGISKHFYPCMLSISLACHFYTLFILFESMCVCGLV